MHSMIIVELLWLNVLCLVLLRPPVRVMASNLEIPSSDEGFQVPSSDDGGDFPAAPEQEVMKRPASKTHKKKLKTDKKKYKHYPGRSMHDCIMEMSQNFQMDWLEVEEPALDTHVLWEVYCPPRVAPLLDPDLGNTDSFDATSGCTLAPDSLGLKTMLRKYRQHNPKVVLLSPPCTWFSTLMYSNWYRMLVEKRELGAKEGVWHLGVSMGMAKEQCTNRRYYLFEHPKNAFSWQTQLVDTVPGEEVLFDQCMVGLVDPEGNPLNKGTKIKTNMPRVVDVFKNKLCDGSVHATHGSIQGVCQGYQMSKWSQVYPPQMCLMLAQAIQDTLKDDM